MPWPKVKLIKTNCIFNNFFFWGGGAGEGAGREQNKLIILTEIKVHYFLSSAAELHKSICKFRT